MLKQSTPILMLIREGLTCLFEKLGDTPSPANLRKMEEADRLIRLIEQELLSREVDD